ncbi:MAG: DedA family protein [Gallionellaceae bacterium]|nr:DedA family protein [Gallionellaceae bacterium]
MDVITNFFTADLSLWGLFLSSLLGATLLPGGSELVLIGVLKLHPELLWPALLIATIGNTLGGMISFGMGWLLPQTQQLKYIEHVRKYGAPALLLAWAPLIGDALCIAAGWLRINPWHAALFMLAGKLTRYLLIILSFNNFS